MQWTLSASIFRAYVAVVQVAAYRRREQDRQECLPLPAGVQQVHMKPKSASSYQECQLTCSHLEGCHQSAWYDQKEHPWCDLIVKGPRISSFCLESCISTFCRGSLGPDEEDAGECTALAAGKRAYMQNSSAASQDACAEGCTNFHGCDKYHWTPKLSMCEYTVEGPAVLSPGRYLMDNIWCSVEDQAPIAVYTTTPGPEPEPAPAPSKGPAPDPAQRPMEASASQEQAPVTPTPAPSQEPAPVPAPAQWPMEAPTWQEPAPVPAQWPNEAPISGYDSTWQEPMPVAPTPVPPQSPSAKTTPEPTRSKDSSGNRIRLAVAVAAVAFVAAFHGV
eukprot:TRINITY_DN47022_c0_g1_i1.p1 TRINITY_DN47022_c0_g1~~TRINITY_DN47022_c0_g1_i1.p1  ORF type:complete len:333 (+),score=46.18 TRINITY_DN47022_c0_g1_i1:45-1043(+)